MPEVPTQPEKQKALGDLEAHLQINYDLNGRPLSDEDGERTMVLIRDAVRAGGSEDELYRICTRRGTSYGDLATKI